MARLTIGKACYQAYCSQKENLIAKGQLDLQNLSVGENYSTGTELITLLSLNPGISL